MSNDDETDDLFEDLRKDLKRNMESAGRLSPDVAKYMRGTVWPMVEAIMDRIGEKFATTDETLDELIEASEELLHGDTASLILRTVHMGSELAAELGKALPEGHPLIAKIGEYGTLATEVMERISEITVDDTDPDDEDDEEGEDEDDDGDAEEVADGER